VQEGVAMIAEIAERSRLRAGSPSERGYEATPESWQTQCMGMLSSSLVGYPVQNCLRRLNVEAYTVPKSGGVLVWDKSWKLHVQCVLRGEKEMGATRFGLTADQLLISLDVERFTGDILTQKDIRPLRSRVRECLRNAVESDLQGSAIVETSDSSEHIIWEKMDFPRPGESFEYVVERMCEYVEVLLPKATTAMDEWAEECGYLL
jgi:hypothetical protein